jgi:hypothetical protein
VHWGPVKAKFRPFSRQPRKWSEKKTKRGPRLESAMLPEIPPFSEPLTHSGFHMISIFSTVPISQTRKPLQDVPANAIGCLFTDKKGNVLKDLSKLKQTRHTPHHGTIRGSWPKIVN